MRTSVAVLMGLCVAAYTMRLPATSAKTETITGQLIEISCYWQNKANTGRDHIEQENAGLECARACIIQGFPVGLLTSSGAVYEITGGLAANHNARLLPHLGHTVALTGDITEKDQMRMIAASDLKMVP